MNCHSWEVASGCAPAAHTAHGVHAGGCRVQLCRRACVLPCTALQVHHANPHAGCISFVMWVGGCGGQRCMHAVCAGCMGASMLCVVRASKSASRAHM